MTYWLDAQDHTGSPRGWAPFCERPNDYMVYQNAVKDNGAFNDGTGDQAGVPGNEGALQRAINELYRSPTPGSRYQVNTTHQPRVVHLPPGTYQIKHKLDMRLNTILVGDPSNPPTIVASSDFSDSCLIDAQDTGTGDPWGTTDFLMMIKNVIIDATRIPSGRSVTVLHWALAQACGLSNVTIKMSTGQTGDNGQTGILMNVGSPLAVTDVSIIGGRIGVDFKAQQACFKNVNFTFCTTAFVARGGQTALLQRSVFEKVGTCADISRDGPACFTLLDCTANDSGTVIKLGQGQQVVIQNLSTGNTTSPVALDVSGNTLLGPAPHIDTWFAGNVHPSLPSGSSTTTSPPSTLLGTDGKFFNKSQPTYGAVNPDQVINVKSVTTHKVEGNGSTDDADALNAILQQNASAGKLTYFPYGVYIVKSTLRIPAGTRIVGEGWPVISGSGPFFSDAQNPQPVVQIGDPNNDTSGVCEISEMRFTVHEVLPGAKIVEINLAGTTPGDVGLWNCLITVGGTRDSQVTPNVSSQDTINSKAAFCTMHLTPTSSAYVENLWSWTADHDLDDGHTQIISTGRGLLCEATKGTWFVGTGFEHHWLYQYNFHNASQVFAGLLQTETPYMQGNGASRTVPDPWTPDSHFGDPDYAWPENSNSGTGRGALAVNVNGGSDLYFYNGAHWAFFTGQWDPRKFNDPNAHTLPFAETNMVRISDQPKKLVWYGIATKQAERMVMDGMGDVMQGDNPGGWQENGMGGGVIAAYRRFA